MYRRVLVTGAAGRLGSRVCRDLSSVCEVVALDMKQPSGDYECIKADLSDITAVTDAMRGCDAVAHLGAIPGEIGDPVALFNSNVRGTFNVLEAMVATGARRIVYASSIRIYGAADTPPLRFSPVYVPIDEEHPLLTSTMYGVTKQMSESMCARYNRRYGVSGVALRFSMIICDGRYEWMTPENGEGTLWSYVDVRDAAQAVRLGLEWAGHGFEALNITAADATATLPMIDIMRERYPDLAEIRDEESFRTGRPTAFSIEKAKALIGYSPEHSFTDYRSDL